MKMYQLTKKETVKDKTIKMYIIDSKTTTSNKKEAKLFTTLEEAIQFKESNLFIFAGYNPEQVEVDVNPQVQELLKNIAQMRKELEEMK